MSHLELLLGPHVFDAFVEEIVANYSDGLDVRTVIVERPELFERALVNTMGISGSAILGEICHKICKDNSMVSALDSKPVNFARFVGIMSESNFGEVKSS